MSDSRRRGPRVGPGIAFGLLVLALSGPEPSAAQTTAPCDFTGPAATFPKIPMCVFVGAYRDSSLIDPKICLGAYHGPLPDSIAPRPRTVTMRFRRDRRAEARSDFGGYRIYRVINFNGPSDSSRMVLIRRFSRQVGDERTWNFSVVNDTTLDFRCRACPTASCPYQVVDDSVVTFVDPDSSGNYVKVCREYVNGQCKVIGDSIMVLRAPPGPHDGFRTWYSITYEAKNNSADGGYADMFVPDLANCATPSDPSTCPNLNHKLLNLTPEPVEPTGGPTPDLESVTVVPNPFRANAPWNSPGANELHFTNLPNEARIKIYTVAGDLVAELSHNDRVRDFERWNLKNRNGRDVASGIYIFRVEASSFTFQDRFIVIR